jgi:hypothetical protein
LFLFVPECLFLFLLPQLSFTWLSFYAGTLSAVTSAAKAILSKKVLSGKPLGENLTPSNMFAVLTILGFFMILPASLAIEGPAAVKVSTKCVSHEFIFVRVFFVKQTLSYSNFFLGRGN